MTVMAHVMVAGILLFQISQGMGCSQQIHMSAGRKVQDMAGMAPLHVSN